MLFHCSILEANNHKDRVLLLFVQSKFDKKLYDGILLSNIVARLQNLLLLQESLDFSPEYWDLHLVSMPRGRGGDSAVEARKFRRVGLEALPRPFRVALLVQSRLVIAFLVPTLVPTLVAGLEAHVCPARRAHAPAVFVGWRSPVAAR